MCCMKEYQIGIFDFLQKSSNFEIINLEKLLPSQVYFIFTQNICVCKFTCCLHSPDLMSSLHEIL